MLSFITISRARFNLTNRLGFRYTKIIICGKGELLADEIIILFFQSELNLSAIQRLKKGSILLCFHLVKRK